MKFWEVIKAYEETGAKSNDLSFISKTPRTPQEHLEHQKYYSGDVFQHEFELEPQKIEVTREMLAEAWDHCSMGFLQAESSQCFKKFAESLGFK